MKKTLLVLVILFVAALLVIAPFFVGKTAEAQFYNAQNKMQALDIAVSSSYSRGWFGSQAESRMNLYDLFSKILSEQQHDELLILTSFVVQTDHEIQHGPIVLNRFDGYHSIFKPVVAAVMNKSTLSGPTNALPTPIHFSTFTTMEIDGSYNTDFSLASGMHTIQGDNPVTIHYDDVSADLNISRDFKNSSCALAAPSIALNDDTMLFSVSNIAFAAKMGKGSYDIPLGTVSFHVTNIVFSDSADGEQANLKNISFSYEMTEANSNLTFSMDTALQSLVADGELLGPATLSYTIRNLDIESLMKLQKLLVDQQKAQQSGKGSEINNFFLMTQMISIVPQMLEKSPELEVSTFELKTPDGDFSGNALVTLHASDSVNLLDMQSILQIITATIHLAMPAGFVEEYILSEDAQSGIPQMAILGNLLKKSGDEYILDIDFNKGILTINGQELPLP